MNQTEKITEIAPYVCTFFWGTTWFRYHVRNKHHVRTKGFRGYFRVYIPTQMIDPHLNPEQFKKCFMMKILFNIINYSILIVVQATNNYVRMSVMISFFCLLGTHQPTFLAFQKSNKFYYGFTAKHGLLCCYLYSIRSDFICRNDILMIAKAFFQQWFFNNIHINLHDLCKNPIPWA